jgi:glycosyltransferase involved in cell wall biosynthesis
MPALRVLHLGKFYPPAKGGIETILKLVCERTAAEVSNRVLVANHVPGSTVEMHGSIAVTRLPVVIKIGAVAVCPTLPMQLARERADVVVLHEPNPMALLAYFLARPAGKLIIWFHSEVIRPSWRYRLFYRPFLQFALARATRIIVASPTLASSAPQLREWESKCVVIPYGIDVEEASAETVLRAESIQADHARPIVLFVGRLVGYKGVQILLEAMRGVAAKALLVGDGPERAALQHKSESLGVADRVAFLGEVTDGELAALYRACDVVVLPSVTRQEAFGVVQIEAMARGKPVISTDLGTGVAWVNQHGETGLVVPPRNADALHDAIQQLVSDPARCRTLGAAGTRRARSVFTVDRMTQSLLSLYREVAGDHGRQAVA